MRDAGRTGNGAHVRHVDARVDETIHDHVVEEVAADARDEVGRSARAARGDDLIRALAAEHEGEVVAQDRLTGHGQARRERGEVGRDGSHDDDPGESLLVIGHGTTCVSLTAPSALRYIIGDSTCNDRFEGET